LVVCGFERVGEERRRGDVVDGVLSWSVLSNLDLDLD